MKIGNIDLGDFPVLLAPMEDVTDPSFRLICKEQGAAMVYTEFVSAEALVRDIPSTVRKLKIDERERPVAIQIYGREPEAMAQAAGIAQRANPDFIDINFGCPVKKVAGKGAGAGLLKDIPKLIAITQAVVKSVNLPVTVKTRLGWDCEHKIISELAPRLQDCGIKALTVHGRTRSQMYTGDADWTMIGELKMNPRLEIPVIGNGDITTPEKALNAFNTFGVDAVMVGRGAIGAPWIFKEINSLVKEGEYKPVSLVKKFDLLLRQIHESVDSKDEHRGILHIRRHLAASPLFKGIPDFRPTRIKMLRADTLNELEDVLSEIKTRLLNL